MGSLFEKKQAYQATKHNLGSAMNTKEAAKVLSLYKDFSILFWSTFSYVDSIGRVVKRDVFSQDIDDVFRDRSGITAVICVHDESYDLYDRVDSLEAGLEKFLTELDSNAGTPTKESLVALKALREDMLPLIGKYDLSTTPIGGSKDVEQLSEPLEEFDEGLFGISIDISYEREDRMGLRMFADEIDDILVFKDKEQIVLKTKYYPDKHGTDNYHADERINALELTIDKLLAAANKSKSGKVRVTTVNASRKVLNNTIKAY